MKLERKLFLGTSLFLNWDVLVKSLLHLLDSNIYKSLVLFLGFFLPLSQFQGHKLLQIWKCQQLYAQQVWALRPTEKLAL